MKFFALFILVVLLCTCCECFKEICKTDLLVATVMFRHGKRTPEKEQMDKFPNYAEKNNKFDPYGVGELTMEGKEGIYDLGLALKKRYNDTLSLKDKGINICNVTTKPTHSTAELNKEESNKDVETRKSPDGNSNCNVKMESTNYTRSQMSAQLVLAGLKELDRNTSVHKNWTREELNLTYNSEKEKWLKYFYRSDCKLFLQQVMKATVLSFFRLGSCISPIAKMIWKLGVPFKKALSPQKVWEMYEVFKAQENANVTLPDWVTQGFFQTMENCINPFLKTAFGSVGRKQLSGGYYVDSQIKLFDKVINDSYHHEPPLQLFSGHDTTVAPAVAALGGENGYTCKNGTEDFLVDIPTYGAAIIVELHKEKPTGNHFVKIIYWNGRKKQMLKVKGCGTKRGRCYLDDYKRIVKSVRMNETELQECKTFDRK